MVRSGQIRLLYAALALSALGLAACPHQELAPLIPCTIAGASIDAAQSGVDKVDVLFVIDNSGSMSEEQIKLSQQLPKLVRVLATGDRDGQPNADGLPDFVPVASLHLGVVSSDLGVNGKLGVRSCGDESFLPTERNVRAPKQVLNKPHGDEGRLLQSSEVAVAGVNVIVNEQPSEAIPPRPECAGVSVNRFLEFRRGMSNVDEIAHQFGCIAELGVTGCGFEQQLESMWRALAPSSDHSFSGQSAGQGAPSGSNAGFLREDAILVVIMVSDEEDCSSPDASRDLVYVSGDPAINVLCSRNPGALHPVQRYIDGLKSLKPGNPERVIFAGIIGVPLTSSTHGKDPDQLLALPEMQIAEDPGPPLVLKPSCIAANGAGRADPARRMVQVAKGFLTNGVITSICEDDYGPALDVVIDKIAEKLSGACLPRQLKVNANGLVDCQVVEIKAANDSLPCAQTPGRERELAPRVVLGSQRIVCEVTQLAVKGHQIPQGQGWYYDDFSDGLLKSCKVDRQRVAFAASSPLSEGALARVECQQSVLNAKPSARGVEAINAPCIDDGMGAIAGDAKCQQVSLPGEPLLCVQGTCQLGCTTRADCPPGYECTADGQSRGFCVNPTCPISDSDLQGPDATVPAGS